MNQVNTRQTNKNLKADKNLSAKIKSVRKTIPKFLIYEEINGNPIYYRDYKQVINNKKTFDDIMGSSSIQTIIVSCILKYLHVIEYLNKDFKYTAIPNELGIHIGIGNNLAADIAIYEKDVLKDYKFDEKYIAIPPKIIIEVDTKADLNDFDTTMDYIKTKTKKLFEFGVEKLFWILTKNQQVIVANPDGNWLLLEWDKEIRLTENIKFSLANLLEKEGVKY